MWQRAISDGRLNKLHAIHQGHVRLERKSPCLEILSLAAEYWYFRNLSCVQHHRVSHVADWSAYVGLVDPHKGVTMQLNILFCVLSDDAYLHCVLSSS